MQDHTKLLDWIATNIQMKEQTKQNFMHIETHPDKPMTPPKEPKFSAFYQLSKHQKQGELLLVGGSGIALGYAAFCFL